MKQTNRKKEERKKQAECCCLSSWLHLGSLIRTCGGWPNSNRANEKVVFLFHCFLALHFLTAIQNSYTKARIHKHTQTKHTDSGDTERTPCNNRQPNIRRMVAPLSTNCMFKIKIQTQPTTVAITNRLRGNASLSGKFLVCRCVTALANNAKFILESPLVFPFENHCKVLFNIFTYSQGERIIVCHSDRGLWPRRCQNFNQNLLLFANDPSILSQHHFCCLSPVRQTPVSRAHKTHKEALCSITDVK